jgi:precorrin-2/cobalt-factor-2 C20-methyltransferase
MSGEFYGIGVGPGDPELMTVKALKIISNSDIVAIPESGKGKGSLAYEIAEPYFEKEPEILKLVFPMIGDGRLKSAYGKENALRIKEKTDAGKKVVFLTLGDPMIYSTYIYLLEHLAAMGVKAITIPGITSFSAISASLGIPLVKGDEKLAVIPEFDGDTENIAALSDCVIFMKVSGYKDKLADFLCKNSGRFVLVSDAGRPKEKVTHDLDNLMKTDLSYFSTLIYYRNKT